MPIHRRMRLLNIFINEKVVLEWDTRLGHSFMFFRIFFISHSRTLSSHQTITNAREKYQ